MAIGYAALLYLLQDGLIFYPRPLSPAQRLDIAKRYPAVQEIFLDSRDGERLHAWYAGAAKPSRLVIYFGGNAEEVSWMLEGVTRRTPGVGWLLVDYRGYGLSAGSPSEAAIKLDALAWHDHAVKVLGAKSIVAFGRSLGSGAAVFLASQRKLHSVILVTPFDSLVEVAAHYYPWLPVGWMLKHRFESVDLAPKLTIPLLCLAATRDEVIPVKHAMRLYEAWAGPKAWVALEGGHNSTDGSPLFWPNIEQFLLKTP